MNSPIQIISFLSKLCSKILFFRKLFSTFCSLHNSKSLVKNSENPPIRFLVHNHIQILRLIGYIVINQRKYLLDVKKSCTDLTKGVLSRGVQELILRCIKIRIRKISSGLLGDWTQVTRTEYDKISRVYICIFLRFILYILLSCKLLLKVYKHYSSPFQCLCYLIYRSYIWYQSRVQGWQRNFLHHNSRKDILHNVHHCLMDQTTTTGE